MSSDSIHGYVPSNASMGARVPIVNLEGERIALAAVISRWEVPTRADGSRHSYQLRAVASNGRLYHGRTTGPGGDFRGRLGPRVLEKGK